MFSFLRMLVEPMQDLYRSFQMIRAAIYLLSMPATVNPKSADNSDEKERPVVVSKRERGT